MKRKMMAAAVTMATAALFAVPAFAQGAAAQPDTSGVKLSQAECSNMWNQADASNSGSLSMSQAEPYVTNFKSVDTDSDGMISQAEFTKGCDNGLVKSSASTGMGSGASGSANEGTSDRTPGESSTPERPTPVRPY
jgi:hypothetical protein